MDISTTVMIDPRFFDINRDNVRVIKDIISKCDFDDTLRMINAISNAMLTDVSLFQSVVDLSIEFSFTRKLGFGRHVYNLCKDLASKQDREIMLDFDVTDIDVNNYLHFKELLQCCIARLDDTSNLVTILRNLDSQDCYLFLIVAGEAMRSGVSFASAYTSNNVVIEPLQTMSYNVPRKHLTALHVTGQESFAKLTECVVIVSQRLKYLNRK